MLSSLCTSFVSTLGVEPTGVLLVATGLLSPVEGDLLVVKRDVTMLNADHIIPGCMWGSSSRSLTIAMLELSGGLTSSWCSMMGLVGGCQNGYHSIYSGAICWTSTRSYKILFEGFILHLYGIPQL